MQEIIYHTWKNTQDRMSNNEQEPGKFQGRCHSLLSQAFAGNAKDSGSISNVWSPYTPSVILIVYW